MFRGLMAEPVVFVNFTSTVPATETMAQAILSPSASIVAGERYTVLEITLLVKRNVSVTVALGRYTGHVIRYSYFNDFI